jgi:hypothetical protein
MRRLPILIVLLCAVMALLAPAANASKTQSMTFEAPRDLKDPATRDQAFKDLESLGVSSLRVVLFWHDVAPDPDSRVKPKFDETNPSTYDWGPYDAIVDGAKQRGWKLLLTVSGPVPRWATNGAKDTVTRPSPNEFRMFTQAVAAHYGSKVDTWSVWNEPNQPQFLAPQYSASHKPLSPRIYRNLYLAAQRGLQAAGLGNAHVLLGETSPRGNTHVVAPLTFLRGLLCLNDSYHRDPSCAKLQAFGYAHHAYTTAAGPLFKPKQPNDVTIGVLSRLTSALNKAAAAGAVSAHLPIYLTEFGIESRPDPLRGVSLQRQSEYRAISERIAYYNPRVVAFSQYLLRDDPPLTGVPSVERYGGFQSGLFTAAGRPKPSYDGFRLPLVVRRGGSKLSLWGLVRPATGATKATIQQSSNGRTWRDLTMVQTDARGYFTKPAALVKGRQWRLVWTAPDGTTFRGTATRAYAG